MRGEQENADAGEDEVDDWGRESFPASDPPPTWDGPADGTPRGIRPEQEDGETDA